MPPRLPPRDLGLWATARLMLSIEGGFVDEAFTYFVE